MRDYGWLARRVSEGLDDLVTTGTLTDAQRRDYLRHLDLDTAPPAAAGNGNRAASGELVVTVRVPTPRAVNAGAAVTDGQTALENLARQAATMALPGGARVTSTRVRRVTAA